MISRIEGAIEAIDGQTVRVRVADWMSLDALVPAYLAERLAGEPGGDGGAGGVGGRVTLQTLLTFESQSQGASMTPRLIGFESAESRRFFTLFTTVKGVGARKALRAMVAEPGVIAAAIAAGDHKALEKLPEIGKRMAQTIVAELSGKVDEFALDAAAGGAGSAGAIEARPGAGQGTAWAGLPPVARDAIGVLLALGETAADAERRIRTVLAQRSDGGASAGAESADELVALALRGR